MQEPLTVLGERGRLPLLARVPRLAHPQVPQSGCGWEGVRQGQHGDQYPGHTQQREYPASGIQIRSTRNAVK
ncbi:hypothetical protein Daqu01_00942 [Deinococcus aquaticus]